VRGRGQTAEGWAQGVFFGVLGLILGLGSYLTGALWTHQPVACPATGIVNCQAVLTGPGHVVLGVPLTVWAMGWALVGLRWPRRLWGILGLAGLVWAWSHELADGHLCLWCTALQVSILAAIGLSYYVARKETITWHFLGPR
jgi:uncharacterized membrane protein